jgi:hypothetical protein
MAKLSSEQRDKMPAKEFAGPDRSYPINDRAHAANAKARASQAVNSGRMSPGTEKKIDAKADRVMGKMPERGQRTATHNDSKHPQSHDAWEKLGS